MTWMFLKRTGSNGPKALGFDAQEFMQYRQQCESKPWVSVIKEKLLTLVGKNKETKMPSECDAVRACVQVATEALSQRLAVFSERTLLKESMKHSLMVPQAIAKKTLIEAIQHEKRSQTLYEAKCPNTQQTLLTTPWLLTLEAETIARIENNKGAVPALASHARVASFQKERAEFLPYPLTASQSSVHDGVIDKY